MTFLQVPLKNDKLRQHSVTARLCLQLGRYSSREPQLRRFEL